MFIDILQIFLIAVAIALAILTIELRDLLHAALCLCGMGIVIGMLFSILNASYVAVFQLLIYAGAVVVLFISVIMLTTRRPEE
ncbi:MAG: NADH-quinone oxidoreductase subunit J [Candidatus Bathyarchaeia archaeon]